MLALMISRDVDSEWGNRTILRFPMLIPEEPIDAISFATSGRRRGHHDLNAVGLSQPGSTLVKS